MKIHFIAFANTNSKFSLERIRYEAEKIDVFDDISCYTEKDIDSEFLEKYGDNFKHKRGYGYWCWKPYFIKKKLSEAEDGDVVVYADCGCTINKEKRKELIGWINKAQKAHNGVFSPCYGPYLEREWTRMDLYDYVNKTYNKENIEIFENSLQYGATSVIVCKNKKSEEFISAWYDIMTNHFHLCTDEESTIPNHKDFIENRHDQSAFSLLAKIFKVEMIESLNNGISDKNNSPIYASRLKRDKNTWKRPKD